MRWLGLFTGAGLWILSFSACSPGDVGEAETDGGTESGTDGAAEVFDGLSEPVEIVIDDQGIPHIYAKSDLDLFYAAGYQMATDRLFQMDLMRRRAMGTQAEILGSSKLGSDQTSRLFDFARWGSENLARLQDEQPQRYALLDAWVTGVNRRIEQVRAGEVPLPYGFGPGELDYMPAPFTVEEHGAIVKMLFFGQSNSLERELLATIVQRNFTEAWDKVELCRPAFAAATMPPEDRPQGAPLGPQLGTDGPPSAEAPTRRIDATDEEIVAAVKHLRAALADFPRTGSNNWAVHGSFTDNGRSLVAGDPHQPLQSPSLMYTQHLSSVEGGGTYDAMGWAFAGAAGIHLGHNRHVHWTATTNFADVMDIWEVEEVDGGVRVGDQILETVRRDETIVVAGEDDVTYTVYDVPNLGPGLAGVLLPDDLLPIPVAGAGHALLLGWTGFSATSEEMAFMSMAEAQSVEQFEAAVDLMEVGGFNFVAADANDITYRVSIDVPDRGDPSARQMPYVVLDGDDGGSMWSSYLPPEKMPRSRASQQGWLATANNDPWGFTFDGDVSNDPWYYGYFYAAGHRAKRLQDELTRLTAQGGVTVADMQALQTDTHSVLADALLPVLQEVTAAVDTDPALEEFRERGDLQTLSTLLTEQWNRRMDRDQAGALAFHVWLLLLTEEVVADELSILYTTVLGEETPFVVKLPMLAVTGAYPKSDELMQEGRDVLVMRALDRTASLLTERFGSVDPAGYTWGEMHGTRFDNPFGGDLDVGWVPTDGGEDTLDVSSSAFLDDAGQPAQRFDSKAGAIFRVVTTFDDDGTPRSYANFPPGNVEDPRSPHFDDALQGWVDGEYRELAYRRSEVDARAEQTIVLQPAEHPAPSAD